MAENINNKKALAEQIKQKLNSPDYVAIPDLITHNDRYGDMSTWIWGKKDWKENWIEGLDINPGKGNKKKSEDIIYGSELEKEDFDEIVNLIEKRNKEKEQIFEQKRNNIKEKLNNTPNLYYHFNNQGMSASYFDYPDKHGKYFYIWGVENGRGYYLNININHPALNNFSWEKNGYYLIKTDKQIERNDKFGRPWSTGGETNPSNFHKWIEVGDQITITPYEVENYNEALEENQEKDLELRRGKRTKCDVCQKAWEYNDPDNWYLMKNYHGQTRGKEGGKIRWAHLNCYPTKEKEYLENYQVVYRSYFDNNGVNYEHIKRNNIECYANKKDQNGKVLKQENCHHCQPWKKSEKSNSNELEKEIINWLVQYFQENNIKEINLKNGELEIVNNNNKEVKSHSQITTDPELKNIQNWLERNNQKHLDRQNLNIANAPQNSPSQNEKKDYTPYLAGGAIVILITAIVVIAYFLGKRKSKKNI